MLFSKRNKYKSIRTIIQKDDLDEATRNALWNIIWDFFKHFARYCEVYVDLWTRVYEETADTCPNAAGEDESERDNFCRFYRNKILCGDWYECFDIIEFLVDPENTARWNDSIAMYSHYHDASLRPEAFNSVFEKYMVGYRFVGTQIVPITSDAEVDSVEEAIVQSKDSVAEQLSKAVAFLSDRDAPDYAKSVDCSISAVEAQCRHLLGSSAPTLGKALKQIEDNGFELHESLKSAFDKLYGFTSNVDGIRHAGLKPSEVDADLAKFMLVSCSAFVNYLRAKQDNGHS